MRKIEIKNFFLWDKKFADDFINEGHRETKKVRPHTLIFTFNLGNDIDMNKVNFMIELLYQAMIIKNPIDKIMVNIDKRNRNYLTMDIW